MMGMEKGNGLEALGFSLEFPSQVNSGFCGPSKLARGKAEACFLEFRSVCY